MLKVTLSVILNLKIFRKARNNEWYYFSLDKTSSVISFMMEDSIIQKLIHWLALQINGLVSMWQGPVLKKLIAGATQK